jgi:hypothetical protein
VVRNCNARPALYNFMFVDNGYFPEWKNIDIKSNPQLGKFLDEVFVLVEWQAYNPKDNVNQKKQG